MLRSYFKSNCKGCTISMVGAVLLLFALMIVMLTSCAAPKATVVHEHHYQEVDSMAVVAQVDKRLQAVKEQVVQEVTAKVSSQLTEQNSQEQEKERITESITTWVDSLGREMRQEQRTTERDISRQQQLREERLQQEYEQRLLTAVDSLDAAWQEKMEQYQAHWEQADSLSASSIPTAEDNRPWWKRWWDAARWMLVGAVVLAVVWLLRGLWTGWLVKLAKAVKSAASGLN